MPGIQKRIELLEGELLEGELLENASMEATLDAFAVLADRLRQTLPEQEANSISWWFFDGWPSDSETLKKVMADLETKSLVDRFYFEFLLYMGKTKPEAEEYISSYRWNDNPLLLYLQEEEPCTE